jgi:hypothetical protein
MKRIAILLAGWLSCCSVLMAQTDSTAKKKKCSCAFSSINLPGLLTSNSGDYFQFQTINGLRYKSWFAGIGVGIDMYPTSGIPVFFDLRKNILKKLNTPFVYADVGVHFADFHRQQNEWQITEYNNGLYYDAGLGYKFGLPKRGGVLVSFGYSHKAVEKRLKNVQVDCNSCNQNTNLYSYKLNRFSIKAGWQF